MEVQGVSVSAEVRLEVLVCACWVCYAVTPYVILQDVETHNIYVAYLSCTRCSCFSNEAMCAYTLLLFSCWWWC